jgi:N-acylneuraminate cytidylyltransferase
MTELECLGLICARAGSKGIKDKNLQRLGDKSLVEIAIAHALESRYVTSVIVSTDSPEIVQQAELAGASVPFMRPQSLCQDDSPEWLAWRHALNWFETAQQRLPNLLVVVPPTSPLRDVTDIDRSVERMQQGDVDVVITMTPTRRNPAFNMVRASGNNQVRLVIEDINGVATRQSAPQVFDMTTVAYVVKPTLVLDAESMWAGQVAGVEVPTSRALDIDDDMDLKLARVLYGSSN